jgi:hypothetical protein
MTLKTNLIVICVSLALVACGALGGGKGKSSKSSYDELSGISADLQAQLDKTMAPVTETDSIIQRLTELPKTLGLSPDDYKDFVIYAIRGEIKAPEGASEEVKKQLTAFGKDLKTYKVKLFATPDEVLELTKNIGGTLVSVPALVGKIEAEAQLTKANPLSTKKEKAQADKRSKEAKGLGEQTTNKVKTIQTEAQSLPGKAKDAITKFTAALKSVGIDNFDLLKDVGSDIVKDAKDAAKQTVDTVKDSAKDSVDAAKSAVE